MIKDGIKDDKMALRWLRFFVLFFSGGVASCVVACKIFSRVHIDLDSEHLSVINVFPYSIIGLLILLPLLFGMIRLLESIKEHTLFILMVLFHLLAGLVLVFFSEPSLSGDPNMIFSYVPAFLSGDYSGLDHGRYFGWYPFLLGNLLYEMLVAHFSSSVRMLFFFNLLFLLLSDFLIWHILQTVFPQGNKRFRKSFLLLLALFFPILLLILYVYGVLQGVFFSLLAIHLILKTQSARKNKLLYFILSTFSFFLSFLFKNNFLLIILAVSLVLFLFFLQDKKLSYLLMALILPCFVFLLHNLFFYVCHLAFHTDIGPGAPPQLLIAMGLQEGATPLRNGWYNGFNFEVYAETGFDYDASVQIANANIMRSISVFLSSPEKAGVFFGYKFLSTWNEPTFQSVSLGPAAWSAGTSENVILGSLYEGDRLYWLYERYMGFYTLLFFSLLICAIIRRCRSPIENPWHLFPMIYYAGATVFHLIVETRSIHACYPVLFLIPTVAYGLSDLYELIYTKAPKWINLKKRYSAS